MVHERADQMWEAQCHNRCGHPSVRETPYPHWAYVEFLDQSGGVLGELVVGEGPVRIESFPMAAEVRSDNLVVLGEGRDCWQDAELQRMAYPDGAVRQRASVEQDQRFAVACLDAGHVQAVRLTDQGFHDDCLQHVGRWADAGAT
jgi:hypothetical protein